jgi:O-antigen/teichoic acid export membrane protein
VKYKSFYGGRIVSEKTRTEYSAKNATAAMISKVLAMVAGFVTRVVFTHTLSQDYVGVNGLFTDILNVLALSELGVGTAITYALYKPIAGKDVERQKSLMLMYRRFYRVVALVVLTLGLLVIPFMDVLIKNQPRVDHLILIYLLYLFNSVASYLLIYKRTLVDAHQLNYISVGYQTVFLLIQYALQIWILLYTGNFILFVSAMLLCTLLGNVFISMKAERLFPYLKDRKVQKLPADERNNIYRNVRAMMMHKIGAVIVNNTDNLLLSSLVGIVSTSMYSNYYLLIASVRQVLNQMFQGITASVGNLGVEESSARIKKIFEASFFVGQWMFGLGTICIFEVIDNFVQISFGEQYVFSGDITLVLCLNFYITGMRQATLVFRDSMGLFRYDRYKALVEAVINLVVSVFLGTLLGTIGIFLGTLISTLATSFWVEPYILYKYGLQTSSASYFLRYGGYAAVTFLLWGVSDKVCGLITGSLWLECILRFLVSALIVNAAYLLIYHATPEFQLIVEKAGKILKKRWAKK